MKPLSEVLTVNKENEITQRPKVVIPYDWYVELCNQLGREATEDEQRLFYGVEHEPQDNCQF